MSTRKLVRGIGENTEVIKVNYNAEIVEDEENLYLVCAGSDIAWSSEEVGGSRYVVSVFAGGGMTSLFRMKPRLSTPCTTSVCSISR